MCNELFGALPHFELGRRWRCRGDTDGEGDGDFERDKDGERDERHGDICRKTEIQRLTIYWHTDTPCAIRGRGTNSMRL